MLCQTGQLFVQVPEYVLLAKQPIYQKDRECIAYELLFRSPMNLSVVDIGPDLATSQVLVNYCASVSEQVQNSGLPVFINVDSEFLLAHATLPVPPDLVVVEITGQPDTSPELLEKISAWRTLGFRFSYDGYSFLATQAALLPHMDFVKVDVQAIPPLDLDRLMRSRPPSSCKWVAQRVEDEKSFQLCLAMGFDYFQGYFLARPENVTGTTIRPGTTVTIKLIKELDRPGISMAQIAELVSQDPKLAIQMLKIINSPLFSLPKQVDDLKEALVYLGIDLLRQWALMIAFLSNGNTHMEACRFVLTRAKALELQVTTIKKQPDLGAKAFLVGLISGVEVLLQLPIEVFVQQVPLSERVKKAVTEREGALGLALKEVIELERSISWQHDSLSQYQRAVLQAYDDAGEWAGKVIRALRQTV